MNERQQHPNKEIIQRIVPFIGMHSHPTLRLPGNSNIGGVVSISLIDEDMKVQVVYEVPIGGTNGTEWQKDVTSFPVERWPMVESIFRKQFMNEA